MSVAIYILLIISCSVMTIDGRPLRTSDQLMPFLVSSVNDEGGNAASSLLNGSNRLLYVIEHILKYVSTIKSSEHFIDGIIDRQEEIPDKLIILKFLKNCFRISNTFIQREINLLNSKQKSFFSSSFTFEELQQAHNEINNLLQVIDERMAELKTWIPPTMPFLNF